MDFKYGIKAIEIYFPKTFVEQSKLEKYYNVSNGKYKIGLGQNKMAFTNSTEDINSMFLTVTESLMTKYNIDYKTIGRLEIGTETIIDKSKSLKTKLMKLFKNINHNIEGVDNLNACYGGTSAIFNSLAWLNSKESKNKDALVIIGDIAVYEKGPARPTGGCGAIALLLGKNAPLVFEEGTRFSYMDDIYDFFKPNLSSEYPVVDGQLSNKCYLNSLNKCYNGFKKNSNLISNNSNMIINNDNYFLFHTPYSKLIQKAFYNLIDLEKLNLSNENLSNENLFNTKVLPGLTCSKELGNTYTASLWMCLVSLINNLSLNNLYNKKFICFSYGSGITSTMFSININNNQINNIKIIKENLNLNERLFKRIEKTPEYFEQSLNDREIFLKHKIISNNLDSVQDDSYYLYSINDNGQRFYKKKKSLISKL